MKTRKTNQNKWVLIGLLAASGCLPFLSSCSDDFLKQDPLSFYDPAKTYSTESGLKAVLSTSDKQLRDFYSGSMGYLLTENILSDISVRSKTDEKNMFCNVDGTLTPTALKDNTGSFWSEGFSGVKYANTVISNICNVQGLDEKIKNAYLGRAYFHRAFRYLMLVFQFDNVPLFTQLVTVPKQDYASCSRDAILQKMTEDLEFAVEWVPKQSEMSEYGAVNKEACQQLLIKYYLATGQFEKAKTTADDLINNSGHRLLQESDNASLTYVAPGEAKTWPVTSNIIWNMHRPENKLTPNNPETLLGAVDMGSGNSFTNFETMRTFGPYWNDPKITGPDGVYAVQRWARNNANYKEDLDFVRALGRGIASGRLTWYAEHTLWEVNGKVDDGDLRHSAESGNWFPKELLKYNDPKSKYYGKTFKEVAPHVGDSVRSYFSFPLYKVWLKDVMSEEEPSSNNFIGATKGGVAHWYVYRLAETYLLRAEAKFYLGDATGAAEDVNAVRKRAGCKQLYTTVTIGDIMDERARELYLEEFRHVELSRVSLCLALSGKPDEFGNTYNKDTYDKQEGTDRSGGSYWYQRIIHYNNYYNTGKSITTNGNTFLYQINKHNLYWPIPDAAIKSNSGRALWQNFGYDGYNPDVQVWKTWQEAAEDETKAQ